MNLRELFALTFVLEKYFEISSEGYSYSGCLNHKAIAQALKTLFGKTCISAKEISDDLKKFGVNIPSTYIKRFSEGNFEIKLKIVNCAGHNSRRLGWRENITKG